ncbi:hypothetical protein [Burkholderia cepacia]|nr:hypothetical protein [Burkholderia cepacia]
MTARRPAACRTDALHNTASINEIGAVFLSGFRLIDVVIRT